MNEPTSNLWSKVKNKYVLISVILLCLLSFLLPFLIYSLNQSLGYDESVIVYSSWLNNQGSQIYKNTFNVMQKTPGTLFFVSPFIEILGNTYTAVIVVRIVVILLKVITGLLIFKIGEKIANKKVGLFALLFFSISSIGNAVAGFIWTENFSTLCITLAIYILLVKGWNNHKNIILSGFLLGLAILFKQSAVFLIIGFGLVIVFYQSIFYKNTSENTNDNTTNNLNNNTNNDTNNISFWNKSLLFGLGILLALLPLFLLLYKNQALNNFYLMVVEFNKYHPTIAPLWMKIGRFLKIMVYNPEFYIFGAIAGFTIIKSYLTKHNIKSNITNSNKNLPLNTSHNISQNIPQYISKNIRTEWRIIVGWFIFTLGFSLLIPRETFEHYFYESLPAISLLLGLGAYIWLEEIKLIRPVIKKSIFGTIILISVLINFIAPIYSWDTIHQDKQIVNIINEKTQNKIIFTDQPKYLFLSKKNQDFYFLASQENAYNKAGLTSWKKREIQKPKEFMLKNNIQWIIINRNWDKYPDYFLENKEEEIKFITENFIKTAETNQMILLEKKT